MGFIMKPALVVAVAAALTALPLGSLAAPPMGHVGVVHAGNPGPPPALGVPPPVPPVAAPPAHAEPDRAHEGIGRRNVASAFGWWPSDWGSGYYQDAGGRGPATEVPAPTPEAWAPPTPPPCPELIEWSPKLGHAIRHRLCEE